MKMVHKSYMHVSAWQNKRDIHLRNLFLDPALFRLGGKAHCVLSANAISRGLAVSCSHWVNWPWTANRQWRVQTQCVNCVRGLASCEVPLRGKKHFTADLQFIQHNLRACCVLTPRSQALTLNFFGNYSKYLWKKTNNKTFCVRFLFNWMWFLFLYFMQCRPLEVWCNNKIGCVEMIGLTHRRRWYVIFIRDWLVELSKAKSNDSCWISWSVFLLHFQSLITLAVVPDDPASNQMEDTLLVHVTSASLDHLHVFLSHVNVSLGLCACAFQVVEDLLLLAYRSGALAKCSELISFSFISTFLL